VAEERPNEAPQDEDDGPLAQAVREAVASGEIETNPNWLEDAATRALNQELGAAANPLERWEELVDEFRLKGHGASLAAQKAARAWVTTADARQGLRDVGASIPDGPAPSRTGGQEPRGADGAAEPSNKSLVLGALMFLITLTLFYGGVFWLLSWVGGWADLLRWPVAVVGALFIWRGVVQLIKLLRREWG
jgi:hypothetical protein